MMADEVQFRIIKVWEGINEGWVKREFEALKKGDVFRSYEADGSPVSRKFPHIAMGDPVPCDPPGNWKIDVDDYKEELK